jgi:signal transduction histidine kinase
MIYNTDLNYVIQHSKKLTILYVEDDKDSRNIIVDTLSYLFKNIVVAKDGQDGLEQFKLHANDIDIILTDINMPYLNGIEMLRAIREIDKTIYCIILSAYNQTDFFIESIELGIDGYILKPINMQQFLNVLSKIIHHIQIQKELLEYQTNLELKIKDRTKQLQEQSRFAAMGEMIAMIAHQWRQPLSLINTIIAPLHLKYKMGMNVEAQDAIERFERQNEVIEHLNNTIYDFLGFFKDSNNTEILQTSNIVITPQRLVSAGFNKIGATFNNICDIDIQFTTKSSKLNQVIMNIYKNSLDEFKTQNKSDGIVTTSITKYNNCINIIIEDNAGGIPEDILPNIWDAYFSTKDKNGTGLGLYMSKTIVEKHLKGTIKATNKNDGAVFTICLPIIK